MLVNAGLVLGWMTIFSAAYADSPPIMLSEGRLINLRQPTNEVTFKIPYPGAGERGQICGAKMMIEADMAPDRLIGLSDKLEVFEGHGAGVWNSISPKLGTGFKSYLRYPTTAKNTYEVMIKIHTADNRTLSDVIAEVVGDRHGFVGLATDICR